MKRSRWRVREPDPRPTSPPCMQPCEPTRRRATTICGRSSCTRFSHPWPWGEPRGGLSAATGIVGRGRQEPMELGAEVAYLDRGETLNVWEWSKSQQSRVMKDIRLWPDQTFCLSPDGTLLGWATGDVLNLTSGARSTID